MTERVSEGYRAFNGYVFTKGDAEAYNAACDRAERSPSENNINGRHNLFTAIIQAGNKEKS